VCHLRTAHSRGALDTAKEPYTNIHIYMTIRKSVEFGPHIAKEPYMEQMSHIYSRVALDTAKEPYTITSFGDV